MLVFHLLLKIPELIDMLLLAINQKAMQLLITILNLPDKMRKIFIHPHNTLVNMLDKPGHIINNIAELPLQLIAVALQQISTAIQRMHLMYLV